jgi:aminomethyltransferase
MELKTPLYEKHVSAGGRIVPFAGYLLPVQYKTGVIAEHMAVRTACGLFDVSHMGEIIFSGKDALSTIQRLFTNDFSVMEIGRVRYSPMCNDAGGILDDLITYKFADDEYYVVVNASNRYKDAAWMRNHLSGDTVMTDISDTVAQLALQGPKAQDILARITDAQGLPRKYYSFAKDVDVAGTPCLVSRTGYTGEDGFEIYCANEHAPALWDSLLKAGAEDGLIPCGLGARDTLRLEAGMPLYGHEMDETVTPLETGLGMFVKPDKGVLFIGRDALAARGGPHIARIGLEITGRGIAREACIVYSTGKAVGHTTSGTHCPYLDHPVAMALVDTAYSAPGTRLEVDVRGRMLDACVVPLPFYKRPGKA